MSSFRARAGLKHVVAGAVLAASLLGAAEAHAEPTRILVAVGQKLGLAAETPLKYADQDAIRVRDVLVGLGGVKPENAFVLTSASRAQLVATIDRAKAQAAKNRPEDVTLVFYFSGHGDREALHLDGDRVPLTELQAKLGEVPAALRLSVTDACRTTREKGFVADEPFAISATTTPQATGQVWLHASSDGEAAQESDELQGAIFTHTWLNGLRGAADANGDARVTLDESFAFAHSQTLIRSAKSSGVLQKPEAVVTLRELAPLVLTQTAPKMAKLALPATKDAHFLVYAAGSKSVLSEVWGAPDRRIALAVPPGRYVVLRRFGSTGSSAQLALGTGESRELGDGDFTAESLTHVARKGDEADEATPPDAVASPSTTRSPNELAAGWDAGADTRTGLVHGPRAGYTHVWNRFALGVGGGATFAARDVATGHESLVSGYGRASVELRLPLGATLLRSGVAGRAGWLAQTVSRTNAPSSSFGAFVLAPEAFVALRRDLGSTLFAEASVTGLLVGFREEDRTRLVPTLLGGLGVGAKF